MKNLLVLFLMVALVGLYDGCSSDDDNTVEPEAQEAIIGAWLSTGANIAPLLAGPPFNVAEITATFAENNTYTVLQKDNAGTEITLTGTYTMEKSAVGNIYTIVLNQASPSVLTAEGIYEINTDADPDEMTYEVVQTEPAIGVAPPTPELGFGSTGAGAFATLNVQKYVRK